MKKKIVLVVALTVALFGGVVGASSINGDYKGNPIVKVRVNGQLVDSEVPAQILDGSTLLPLRAVSEALGAELKWNQETYSVDLTAKTPAAPTNTNIGLLKMYSEVAEQYRRIGILLDMTSELSDSLSLSFNSINQNLKPSEQLKNTESYLNQVINNYNSSIQTNEQVITKASKYNLDIYDTRTMHNDINKSLDYYKAAYNFLVEFYQTNSNTKFDQYLDNNGKGFDNLKASRTNNIQKYFEYYNKVQNY